MRNINLRVYDSKRKVLTTDIAEYSPNHRLVKYREEESYKGVKLFNVWLKEEPGSALMLSTNLLDKNRKEIYEGDILLFPDTESEYVDVGIGGSGVKVAETECNSFFPIEYRDGEFGMEISGSELVYGNKVWLSLRTFFKDYISEKECEVIGNIYENPELLTAMANGTPTI